MADEKLPANRATLADVLGALVTSVSRARVQADLSSIEIARLYHGQPLLRGLPVPRLRLNRVEVVVPLVVDAVRPQEPFELASPAVAAKGLLTDMERALNNIAVLNAETLEVLNDQQVLRPDSETHQQLSHINACVRDLRHALHDSLEPPTSSFVFETRFANALNRTLEVFSADPNRPQSSVLEIEQAAADAIERVISFRIAVHRNQVRKTRPNGIDFDLAELYPQILGTMAATPFAGKEGQEFAEEHHKRLLTAIPDLLRTMRACASRRVFSKVALVPEIEIAAHTTDVKTLGNPDTITRLRMTMSEEGLEWVAESSGDAKPQWKLMPE